jgi:hypothetical protein
MMMPGLTMIDKLVVSAHEGSNCQAMSVIVYVPEVSQTNDDSELPKFWLFTHQVKCVAAVLRLSICTSSGAIPELGVVVKAAVLGLISGTRTVVSWLQPKLSLMVT